MKVQEESNIHHIPVDSYASKAL